MNKELDIAAILRDKPKGTKLWSPAFGDVELDEVCDIYFCIQVVDTDGCFHSYNKEGNLSKNGECVLFPSKAMRDWEKFAWKKGDVLLAGVDNFCIFDSWENDDYTEFNAKYVTPNYSSAVLETKGWTKVERDDIIRDYIKMIEEIKCGKLNLSTLEIEKPKPQFKDGDIVFVTDNRCYNAICIYKKISGNMLFCHAKIDADTLYLKPQSDSLTIEDRIVRIATEEDKQQLFDVLAKEGKAWNAEKKQIVDLSKKHVFKPFDKVLMRDNKEDEWKPFFFLKEKDGAIFPYYCINDNENRKYCIPYEGNEHLLGTTDSPKEGGEG